jgi:hypothetical protein
MIQKTAKALVCALSCDSKLVSDFGGTGGIVLCYRFDYVVIGACWLELPALIPFLVATHRSGIRL